MNKVFSGTVAASLLLFAGNASAHHSYAMFDPHSVVTLDGTVKEFQWVNPHTWIQLMVKDAKTGVVAEWSIEGTPTPGLKRRGWTRHSLNPGDHAVIQIHPLRTGAVGGSLISAVVNGKPVGNEGT